MRRKSGIAYFHLIHVHGGCAPYGIVWTPATAILKPPPEMLSEIQESYPSLKESVVRSLFGFAIKILHQLRWKAKRSVQGL